MKITDVQKDDNTLSFTLDGASTSYANTIRRAIMDFVPTLAIEDVELRNNSSVLYDEIVAHRLGLLPITTEQGSYSFRVEGESGLGSELSLTLSAKGPQMVLAKEMKSKDAKAVPAQGEMPIVKLLDGQEIELEAKAILGRGIDHAKWSPGLVYYQYGAQVTVNNNAKDLAKFIAKFPPQVVDGNKISKEKIQKLQLFDAVEGVYNEAVQVEYNPDVLLITVESWGQISPKSMVEQGCQYIGEALDDFAKALKSL